MSTDALMLAVQNNMDWYEAQARTWNIEAHRSEHEWWSTQPVPPYHSNLVASGELPAQTIANIDTALDGAWSIKDAHQQYDLAPLGFEGLFDAAWIARTPAPWPTAHQTQAKVARATNAATLTRWIDAWGETPPGRSVFRPSILANTKVHFLFVEAGPSRISGGLCANESDQAVGITNTFGDPQAHDLCLAYLSQVLPSVPMVGYERGEDLRRMLQRGFVELGDLRIWIRDISG